MSASIPHCQSRASAGFTLVETLLALAITAAVAAGSAAMLVAVSSATKVEQDTRRASVKRQTVIARLGALTRGAAMVIHNGADHIVLWIGDLNENGKPNLSELRRIQWAADDERIVTYAAAEDLDPGSDTTFEVSDDFSSITGGLMSSGLFTGRTILRQVISWEVTLDALAATLAREVCIKVSVRLESGADDVIVISSLRGSIP